MIVDNVVDLALNHEVTVEIEVHQNMLIILVVYPKSRKSHALEIECMIWVFICKFEREA